MSSSRAERSRKSRSRSSRVKRIEVQVRKKGDRFAQVLVGKHEHRGKQLCTGKSVQIVGLKDVLPIVDHKVLGLRTISITIEAGTEDYERLAKRRDRWRAREATYGRSAQTPAR
jgi:hypothetical protein